MGYCTFAVANYFLDLGKRDKKGITPLMVQKLVYMAHGYHLAFTAKHDDPAGEPLVDDEFAEAWQYGPVFPSLYHEFKRFGGDPITEPAEDTDIIFENERLQVTSEIPKVNPDDNFVCTLLDNVWEVYRGYTGYELSSITHKDGSPWDSTIKEGEGFKNTHINNEVIRDYYFNLIGGDK